MKMAQVSSSMFDCAMGMRTYLSIERSERAYRVVFRLYRSRECPVLFPILNECKQCSRKRRTQHAYRKIGGTPNHLLLHSRERSPKRSNARRIQRSDSHTKRTLDRCAGTCPTRIMSELRYIVGNEKIFAIVVIERIISHQRGQHRWPPALDSDLARLDGKRHHRPDRM